MVEGTVFAGLVRGYFEYAVAQGASAEALAKISGVDTTLLDDADIRVPFEKYVTLVRAGKELAKDSALPLRFAEAVDTSEFSVVGLLTHASETLMDALAQLNRYGQLVIEVDVGGQGGRFNLEFEESSAWLVDTRRNPNEFSELTESTFTRLITGPRRFLPRPLVLEAQVTHPEPAHREAYDRIWQCPITFNSYRNALRMDASLATHRIRLQPAYVFGILSAHAEQLLADLKHAKTMRGRVASLLMPMLHTGGIRMDAIASKLGQSRRTLHRKLKEEGITFEQVLEELRHKLALHYLASKKVSVNETAYLVGFSDPASFSRAFKRWTGKSPREARTAE
jgi:AraC-like DNA-binding protein